MDNQTKEIYTQFRNHLLVGRRASFAQFDKTILTLSAGGLALSLTFIDRIIPLSGAIKVGGLMIAWILFTASIMLTLISFITSQFAFDRQLKLAEKYFIKNDEGALTQSNKPAIMTKIINISSAACFILAVIFLLCFVFTNITSGEVVMSKKSKNVERLIPLGEVPSKIPSKLIGEGEIPPRIPSKIEPIEKGEVPSAMPEKPTEGSGQNNHGEGSSSNSDSDADNKE